MKRILLILALALLLCGCAKPAGETNSHENSSAGGAGSSGDVAIVVAANDMWSISLMSAETTKELSGTEAVVQYNGAVNSVENSESPKKGKVFLLLEMIVEKQKNGKSSFVWDKAYVEDKDGNTYHRHENDTFLEVYGLPRLKSVDLSVGSDRGFACYEIPEDAGTDGLRFVYDGAEGQIRLDITL